MAAPMPFDAPVTTATFPSSLRVISFAPVPDFFWTFRRITTRRICRSDRAWGRCITLVMSVECRTVRTPVGIGPPVVRPPAEIGGLLYGLGHEHRVGRRAVQGRGEG